MYHEDLNNVMTEAKKYAEGLDSFTKKYIKISIWEPSQALIRWFHLNNIKWRETDGDGIHPGFSGEALIPLDLYKEYVALPNKEDWAIT